jgi:hypothetical protein
MDIRGLTHYLLTHYVHDNHHTNSWYITYRNLFSPSLGVGTPSHIYIYCEYMFVTYPSYLPTRVSNSAYILSNPRIGHSLIVLLVRRLVYS